MEQLRDILEQLDPERRAYVFARSKVNSDAAAYAEIGVSKTTFYRWEDREHLNQLASQLQFNRYIEAERTLQDALPDAINALINLSKSSDSDSVKLGAIKEILERAMGNVTKKVDVTSNGESIILKTGMNLDDL